MEQPYDAVIILCFRTDNPRAMIVPGATKTKCEKCQYDVWIAPSSLKIKKEMKAKVVCSVCQTLKPKPGEAIDVLPLSNEQISEIKDAFWNEKNRN